jgi:hypothetical protein
MNRMYVLLAALAAIIVILAVALAYMIGRRSSEAAILPANSASVVSAPTVITASEGPAAAAPPAASDPNSDAELANWIIGAWASSTCDTDNGEEFARRGRYYGYESEGRWHIENGNLIVTVTHAQQDPNAGLGEGQITPVANPRPVARPITRNGPNSMGLIVDGRRSSMIRCRTASRSPRDG